jgi:predicted DNA-binding transcriptional regulator AlpA
MFSPIIDLAQERIGLVTSPENLIGASDASALLGIHRTTFWLRRRAGIYPAPVTTVGNRPLFDRAEILAARPEVVETTS